MLILANDGIDASGKALLEGAGHTVLTERVSKDGLAGFLREHNVAALLVRSATIVGPDELRAPSLKVVGRAGVGTDNIDCAEADRLGIPVVNTPAASSQSVAELVMAHAFTLARMLHLSNREMPGRGSSHFSDLKKTCADGFELRGRTLGIIGFGRIGQAVGALALGMGMRLMPHDHHTQEAVLHVPLYGTNGADVAVSCSSFVEVLRESDIVTLHVPGGRVIGREEIALMKPGAIIINTSRGGVVDEQALLEALESGRLAGAGLDVFDNEPSPSQALLSHPRISLSPHIGASTAEAQERIGIELAQKVLAALRGA